jgi:hypothetical protein
MINCSVLSAVRQVYDQYGDLFSECGLNYKASCAILSAPVMGVKTLSDLVRTCPWTYSVSTCSRNVQAFQPGRFMRRMQARILKRYKGNLDPNDFCYAIDDTANPKYGAGIFRSHPSYSSSGPYHGQKVLLVVLIDMKRNIALPLCYAFLTSKKDPNHQPAPQVALDCLKTLLDAGFPKLPVVTDSWFDSADFIQKLRDFGLDFCGEIKSSRLARTNPGQFVKWRKLPQLFKSATRKRLPPRTSQQRRRQKRGKAFSELIAVVKKLGRPLKIIAVYNRMNGVDAFAYYATTNLSLSGEKLWQLSRARWSIECLFRDLKQNLSFGRLPCGGESGADLAVCLPLILVTSMRLDGSAVWKADEYSTIGKILETQREKALSDSIDLIIYNPKHGKIQRMAARRSKIRSKPTNLCGNRKAA